MFRRRRAPQPSPSPVAGVAVEAPPAGVFVATAGTDAVAEAEKDERLLRASQRGDLEAFTTLATRHERAVFNVCLRLLRNVPAAEDAAQDAFVRAWQAVGSFRGGLVRP